MRFDIVSIFPELFSPLIDTGMVRIAREKRLFDFGIHDLRSYTNDPHRKVDDRPFGGGPGMLLMPQPIFAAVRDIEDAHGRARRIVLSPGGRTFDDSYARELAREEHLLLLCGRYEGFDQRVIDGLEAEELSIGDYVLSGGELPAMVVAEAVVRLIPGVLGCSESAEQDSFADLEGYVEYPQYTRPRDFEGMHVPEVLLSGNHEEIRKWREEKAREKTETRNAERRITKSSEDGVMKPDTG